MKIASVRIVPHIAVDPCSRVPLQRQLYQALRRIIVQGQLCSGFRLPPTRALAQALQVSRNTVLFAYEELAVDGLVSGRVGSGTRVEKGALTACLLDPDGHKVLVWPNTPSR